MKSTITLALFLLASITTFAQKKINRLDESKPIYFAEAACGQCKLGLPGKTCDLAVRIDGKAYFVDGVHIDSLGDAHAKDGFCNAIRKADVQGEIVNGRFKATYFALAPKKKE